MQTISRLYDHLEGRIRRVLSHHPIPYSLIGGVAIVFFWEGVARITDSISWLQGLSGGIILVVVSVVVLLITGIFVSFFIGDSIIISGVRGEKKIIDKTEEELEEELGEMKRIERKIDEIESKVDHIEADHHQG